MNSKQPVKASILSLKLNSKTHIKAYKFEPNEGIENENSLTFVTIRLIPVHEKWLIESAGGEISEKVKFGHFIWKNQIKISKKALEFMAHATEILL